MQKPTTANPYDLLGVSYAHTRGIYGRHVTVAVIDTGIALHQDFFSAPDGCRILAFHDVFGTASRPIDRNGHGTHIAGIIGSAGVRNGHYIGIAPGCSLIGIRMLDGHGNGKSEHMLRAIHWILEHQQQYQIRIANISIGAAPANSSRRDTLLLHAVETMWDAGIVVVSAAGNRGPGRQSVTIPGTCPKIITVGACDDEQAVTQHGKIIRNYSGRGPTSACVIKPELLAPGYGIVSCRNAFSGYLQKSGTSMATPFVTGAVALLLEQHPDMTPRDVKLALYHSARDLGFPKEKQGWGLLSIPALLTQAR